MKNRFGLTKNIDEKTKRTIRRNSKFSCVICRAPFCTYEHFDPEYKDAREHNADSICLLCSSCHLSTTRGLISKSAIARYYERRKQESFVKSRGSHPLAFDRMPALYLGRCKVQRADTVICTDKLDCLSFYLDQTSGIFLANMRIFDSKGEEIVRIEENTWVSEYPSWDFEVKGNLITFRMGPNDIVFQSRIDAANNILEITHLNMALPQSRIKIAAGYVHVERYSRDYSRSISLAALFDILDCKAVVFIDNREDIPDQVKEIPILHKPFAGLTFARKGNLHLRDYRLAFRGIRSAPSEPKSITRPRREVYVAGDLKVQKVAFPFWEEEEYFLNGIRLSDRPYCVDSGMTFPDGSVKKVFHVGAPDADLFHRDNGFLGEDMHDLPRAPESPHGFL